MHHSSLGPPAGRRPEGLQFRARRVNLPGSMLRERLDVVRQPVSARPETRRGPEGHLAVHLPGLYAFINRAVLRLPPRARLRQALLRRAVRVGIEAANRRDYPAAFGLFDSAVELLVPPGLASMGLESRVQGQAARVAFESSFLLYHVELVTPPPLVGLGFHPLYRGRDARKDFQRGWIAEWGEMRFEPEDVRDLGDRVLCVGRMKGSGLSSGAGAESDWACLFTLQAGRVIREQPVFDRREALEAGGLRE